MVDLIAPPNIIGGLNQANGAVIAPYADLVLSGGGMNGSVAVNSISAQNAEIRNSVYDGYYQIPAPGAASLLGIAGLVALRRRR